MAKKIEGGTLEDLQKKQEHVPSERVGKILSTIQAARAHFKTIDQSNIGEVLKLVEDDYLQLGAKETAWLQRTLRREHNITVDIGGDESLLPGIIEQPKAPKREKKEISPEEKWRIRKETIINSLKNTFSDPDQKKTAFSVDEKLKEFRNLTAENITELKEALIKEDIHDRKDTTEFPPDAVIHSHPLEVQKKEFIGSRAESDENGVFIEHDNSGYTLIERFGSSDKKRTKQRNDVKISKDLEKAQAENLVNSLNEVHDGLAGRGSIKVSKEGEIKTRYTSKGVKKEIEFKATDIGVTDEELAAWDKREPEFNAARGKMKDKIRAALMNKIINEDFKPAPEPIPSAKKDEKGEIGEQESSLEKLRLMKDIVRMAELREKKEKTKAVKPAKTTPPPLPAEALLQKEEETEVEDADIVEKISIQKLEHLKKLRADLAKAELAMQDAERKMNGWFGFLNIEKKGGAYKEATDAYEAAKKAYQETNAEIHGEKIENYLDEQLALTKERTTAWKKEHSVKDKLSRAWEWFSTANAFEALLGKTAFIKGWREFNESSTGWAKGSRMSGAMKFLGKVASRGVYNLATPRGAVAAALMGVGVYSAGIGESGLLAGSQAARGGMGLVGGYVGGSAVARNLTEWGVNRSNKKILENSSAAVSKEEISERYEAALTRYANVSESLRRGIPNKKLRESKEAELRELSKQVGEFASKLEGGVSRLQEDTMKKTEATRKSRSSREVWYQTAGLVGGLTLSAIGLNRTIEALGGSGVALEENMSRGSGAIESEQENQSVWRPGQEAIVPPKMPVGEMASWDDVGKNQLDAAEQLKKALGLKESIPVHELEKIAKAHHLLNNPADLKAALRAVVSIEITGDNRMYGEALESAITDLAYKAEAGDAIAIATLKKFFESVNMGNVDVMDLDQAEIHKAMLKKVNMHGANGAVAQDVQNKVHFKNRLVVTADGAVRVLQAAGKEAATNVDEIKFLQNLARKVGADPNSVSFKNGWGEVGMKLRGQEILIKNPHSGFDTYEEIREHAENQIVTKAKEAALENPLLNMDRTTVKDLRVYEHLKGIQGLEATLGKQPGISEYAVFVVDNNKLPSSIPRLDGGTKLIGADFRFAKDLPGTTDGKPELWVAAVEREDTPKGITLYKTIAGYGVDGTPNEALGAAVKHANTLKTNLDYAWQATGVSRAETIDLCKAMDIGLDKNATAQLADIKRSLDGDWSALKVDGAYDKTQIAVYKKLPSEFQGTRLQEALADTKTMIKLGVDERLALVAAEQSKKAEDLKALFGVDMKPGKGIQVIYSPDKLTLRVRNVEMAGIKMKEVILNAGTREVLRVEDGWFGGKRLPTVTLDSLKKSSVR